MSHGQRCLWLNGLLYGKCKNECTKGDKGQMRELSNIKRKVFFSYAFKDTDKIDFVSMRLRERGFEIMRSVESLTTMNNLKNFITNVIDECDCFILIITDGINKFSMMEYDAALSKGKNTFVYIKKDIFKGDVKNSFADKIVGLWENEDDLANRIIDDISRYGYSYPQRGYQFEIIVDKIFQLYGCMTEMAKKNAMYDILAKKENITFYVETKALRQRIIDVKTVSNAVASASALAQDTNSKFVLVAANIFSPRVQEILKKNNNIIALDISNLLYIVKDNDILKSQLISILEYSVDDIEPKVPTGLMNLLGTEYSDIDEKTVTEEDVTKKLIKEVQSWKAKDKDSSEYEDLCIRVLKNLFEEDLGLWSDQQRSNEDLYRFDLICKIKDNIQVAFWRFIEEYFRSKYIIFEFKNYTRRITQKEIYTTDKYLYAKALRCVAIIISCEGEDKNAKKAVKGTLRENGKLILSVSNKDLIMMLNGKVKGDSPAEYLYSMLDTMLIELDK